MKIQYTAIACIALLACAFVACDDDDSGESSGTNSYLPLKIGNYWEFVSTPQEGEYTTRTEVTRTVTLQNHQYFELVSVHQYNNSSSRDTLYYRIETNGYVYTFRKNWTKEGNPIRLYADDGDKWTYSTDDYDETTITTSVLDDLEIGDEDLDNCKAFYFDAKQWADEEYTTYLGPRIGFVKYYSAWGFGSRLTKASINGKVYTF